MAKPVMRVKADSSTAPSPDRAAAAPTTTRDQSLAFPSPLLSSIFSGVPSSTGIPVTPLGALQATTVYGCVNAKSQDMAKIPLLVKKRGPNGFWIEDPTHPIADLVMCPNDWMQWFDLVRYMVVQLELRGNAVVIIKRGYGGVPEGLIPVNFDRVSFGLSPRGHLIYYISHPALGYGVKFHQDDVIHVRGMTVDGGYIGISPIMAMQDAVGLAVATQQHGAVLFRQGAQIGGFLSHPTNLSKDAAERLRTSFGNVYGGVQNSHKVAMLEEGVKFEKMQMTNEESQFLMTRQFQVLEICRMFRVPPHKVFDLSRATFSNIEASEQSWINDGLLPVAVNIEHVLRAALFTTEERRWYKLEFEFDALLRGDRKSRYDAYGVGIDRGFLSQNDVRRFEGWGPVPGGDVYRVQVNTAPLGSPAASGTPDQTGPKGGDAENGDDPPDRTDDPDKAYDDATARPLENAIGNPT